MPEDLHAHVEEAVVGGDGVQQPSTGGHIVHTRKCRTREGWREGREREREKRVGAQKEGQREDDRKPREKKVAER